MALASYAGGASYDQSNAQFLDLSDVLSSVLLADTFFLGRVAMGEAGTQTTHYWNEDSLNALTVTAAEDMDASETGLDVTEVLGIRIGALLMDEAIGKSEVMQVTAISAASGAGTLTVVRGVGDSAPAGELHDNATTYRIIGQPVQEGDASVADRSVARLRKSNNYQIFKSEVEISGTSRAVKTAGVADEFNYQIAQRMLEIKRELAQSHLLSVKIAAGSDTVYRSMDGVRNVVRIGGNVITTSQQLTEAVVNSLNLLIWNKGGEANLAVGHESQLSRFAEMYKDKVRLTPSDRQVGRFVTKFLTDKGTELDLVVDRWALKGDLLLVDSSRLSLHPLQGRAMHMEPLAKTGDADRAMLIGEYTQVTRNAAQSHALHSGLTA
jgi:hypothetical protein